MAPNLDCRMYEQEFPAIDTPVMVQVKSLNTPICAYVSLLEYNDLEGMLSFTELSNRRVRSAASLVRVGRVEPVMVSHVDPNKGYVNLSKKRVSREDARVCEERYDKSKHVHSILRHVAETMDLDLEELYIHIGWPLYRKYGHAYEGFKAMVNDSDSVFRSLNLNREVEETDADGNKVTKVIAAISDELKNVLVQNIRRRMSPQTIKIQADIEMTCFEFDGILHIQEAMRKAEAAGNNNCPVKISVVGAPYYALNTQTLDKEQGFQIISEAIVACAEEIQGHKGRLVVKAAPRAVNERDDKLLTEQTEDVSLENEEVTSSDQDSEEEEED